VAGVLVDGVVTDRRDDGLGAARSPPQESMTAIAPPSRITGTSARRQLNTPNALTRSWKSQSSSVVPTSGAIRDTPAARTT